jgi:hypothetical protein
MMNLSDAAALYNTLPAREVDALRDEVRLNFGEAALYDGHSAVSDRLYLKHGEAVFEALVEQARLRMALEEQELAGDW